MHVIDRAVAIIKPGQPFLDWLNRLPNPEPGLTLEELRRDSTAILIPESDDEGGAEAYIRKTHARIFEMELDSWYRDAELWPSKRGYSVFAEWFDVEIYEMVLDASDGRITKEPL